ncbi:hypothetical protein KP003_14155 [Geomonas nitrogeniifigens]|uniref:hypothetical protein n=1 Tax=Geomonas diazotrophica TaxID=2843197 RepID=UPI001C2CA7BD|nr:hypothetical protein [Geomonas nitrogeniifigens]QXE85519.1 hypothetical protein KP003_14155 [Geomonas nitrogeniifigens]
MEEKYLSLERLVYGKLVEGDENGPIVRGPDHGVVMTTGFPQELINYCVPAKTGLGAPPPHLGGMVDWRWEKYPWKEEGGGVICLPKAVSEQVGYMLVARMKLRDEDGEGLDLKERTGGSRRLYHQAQYGAVPIEDWDPGCISALCDRFKATPVVKGTEGTLGPLRLPISNGPSVLTKGWFEDVSRVLGHLLTGQPFYVRKLALPIKDFLASVATALLCLPKTLAWRIPFGAGLIGIETSELRLAHVIFASGGIQELEEGTKGPEIGREDLERGVLYLEWLRRTTEGCTTIKDVVNVISEALPEYSRYDSLGISVDWNTAVHQVLGKVNSQLKFYKYLDWIDADCCSSVASLVPPSPSDTEVFRLLLENLHKPQCFDFLVMTDSVEWKDTWTEAINAEKEGSLNCRWAVKSVQQLVGATEAISPRELPGLKDLPVPSQHVDVVVKKLLEAVQKSEHGKNWTGLYAADGPRFGWLDSWKKEAEPYLFWLGYKDFVEKKDETLLNVMSNCACDRLFASILDGGCDRTVLGRFLKAYQNEYRHVLDFLLRKWLTRVPFVACQIMEVCVSLQIVSDLYKNINEYEFYVTPEVAQKTFSSVSKDTIYNSTLFSKLVVLSAFSGANFELDQLGKHLAYIASGRTKTTHSSDRTLWTLFIEMANARPLTSKQYGYLVEVLARRDSSGEAKIFFHHAVHRTIIKNPILAYASCIYRDTGEASPTEALDDGELRMLRDILDNLNVAPNYQRLWRIAQSAGGLGVFFDLSLPRSTITISGRELSLILEVLFSDSHNDDLLRSTWERRIKEHAPADTPLWNILHHIVHKGSEGLKASKEEVALLQAGVNGEVICLIASTGIQLPGKLLGKISCIPRNCRFSVEGLGRLAMIAREANNVKLADSIVQACVNGINKSGRNDFGKAIMTSQFYKKGFISKVAIGVTEMFRGPTSIPIQYSDIIAYLAHDISKEVRSDLRI